MYRRDKIIIYQTDLPRVYVPYTRQFWHLISLLPLGQKKSGYREHEYHLKSLQSSVVKILIVLLLQIIVKESRSKN